MTDSEILTRLEGEAFNLDLNNEEIATLRKYAAIARKLEDGEVVVIPKASAEMAADVCDEWAELFVATPGFDKYERYNYGPAVEMLRDELRAAAPQFQEEGN